MARPAGVKMSRPALDDVLRLKRIGLTEAAAETGVALKTLSGLKLGRHRASITTARQIGEGLGVDPATLFPELLAAAVTATEQVA